MMIFFFFVIIRLILGHCCNLKNIINIKKTCISVWSLPAPFGREREGDLGVQTIVFMVVFELYWQLLLPRTVRVA